MSEAPPSPSPSPAPVGSAAPRRMFGIKDILTTFNLLGGVVAIALGIEGYPVYAGIAILVGYIGDALDGYVARKLGTSNKFGGEYDAVSDHLSHCIAPAVLLFLTHRHKDFGLGPRGNWALAAALAATIITSGTIRHARNAVIVVEFRGIWGGLNRTVLGFLVLGYVNSKLWPLMPGGCWIAVPLVVIASITSLTYIPFASHRMARKMRVAAKIGISAFFITTFGVLILAPSWAFDVLFFWMAGYSLSSWMAITPEERKLWWQKVAEAKAREQR